jgi:endonuclease I/methionine-rich copper-binding protein CopC
MRAIRWFAGCTLIVSSSLALADANYHVLADAPFAQNWSNTAQITTNNDWSGVPALEGYLSGDVSGATGIDPSTIVDMSSASLQVTPNIASLAGFTAAGVIEAELGDPTIALQATNAADVVFVLLRLNTTGCTAMQLSYRLRDLDADTAVQPYVAQARVGSSGNFSVVPGTFVANANTGSDLPFTVTLPVTLENQAQVQLRWITANAAGADAMIGVDDIQVTGTCTGGVDNPPQIASTAPANNATNVAPDSNFTVNFSEPVNTGPSWIALNCGVSGTVALSESGTGNLRVLDPVPTLAFGETCTANITASAVQDLDGSPDNLIGTTSFQFTIIADNPPTLSSTVPTNGATNVPLASNIQINFSEPVNVSGAWYSIQCTAGGAIAATVSGSGATRTLDPLSNFTALDPCTVTLQPSLIVDLDGVANTLSGTATFAFTTGASASNYYASVDATNATTLRSTLHVLIDDHTAYPYTSSTGTDVWDILESGDENPANPNQVLDVYRNRTYTKVVDRSGATGPTTYNREHTWPNSLGFNDLNGLDGNGNPYSPYTDAHMLYASASDYNANRGNKPFDNCSASCTENPTDVNNGGGGGSGIYPGNSNWVQGTDGNTGTYEVWARRKGDVARAILYMDVRYEGGTAANGQPEPDLIVTNNRAQIVVTPSGQVPAQGYMGVLSTLLAWHNADPPDAQEQLRNAVVYSYQGNRNPFIDHPEYAACLWQNVCNAPPPDAVFANGFE